MSPIHSTKDSSTFGYSNYDLNTVNSYVRMPMSLTTLCPTPSPVELSYYYYKKVQHANQCSDLMPAFLLHTTNSYNSMI